MPHFCDNCGRDFTNPSCPRCGGPPVSRRHVDEQPGDPAPLSDVTDTLDHMIERASRPTLASLLKRGIDSGLIKPAHDYSAGSTPTP